MLAGLWTPAAGVIAALIEIWTIAARHGEAWTPLLAGAIGLGLAMVGPGSWSIDARVFGRKRVLITDR